MCARTIIFLCAAMLSLSALNVRAQRRGRGRARAAPPPARAATPVWSISTGPSTDEAEVGVTLVTLEQMPLAAAAGTKAQARLMARATQGAGLPGQKGLIMLTFFSRANACQFALKDASGDNIYTFKSDLKLQLDGRPQTLVYQASAPQGEGVGWMAQDTEGGDCAESVGVYVTRQTLTKITAARRVTAGIGARTFILTNDNLNALREFARRLAPVRSSKD